MKQYLEKYGFIDRVDISGEYNMALEITHLGSGSRGNCAIINSDDTTVMIDCGFSIKQTEKRLLSLDLNVSDIDAIVVTHHHQDHSKSAMRVSKKWNTPLYCNQFTAKRMKWESDECNISAATLSHLAIKKGKIGLVSGTKSIVDSLLFTNSNILTKFMKENF